MAGGLGYRASQGQHRTARSSHLGDRSAMARVYAFTAVPIGLSEQRSCRLFARRQSATAEVQSVRAAGSRAGRGTVAGSKLKAC